MNAPLGYLVIIGVGLIGGSLARALRRAGFVQRISGTSRSEANLKRARALGVIDDYTTDLGTAVHGADMVLICVPMGAYDTVFSGISGGLAKHAVVTDAGSTKVEAIEAARRHLPDISRFVPAHPIAGTEDSGVDASFAELFDGRLCVITPDDETDEESVSRVRDMWQAAGSRVTLMNAAEHDDFLASVSHLPHVVAYALVNAVRKQGNEEHDPFRFAAGGFRDFTRIASSSPEMWRDIALANRGALLHKLDALGCELAEIRQLLEAGDGERLLEVFEEAKQSRDAWIAGHGESL